MYFEVRWEIWVGNRDWGDIIVELMVVVMNMNEIRKESVEYKEIRVKIKFGEY